MESVSKNEKTGNRRVGGLLRELSASQHANFRILK